MRGEKIVSNEKKEDAALKNYEGPFFPKQIERVQKRYHYSMTRWNAQFFDRVADALHAGVVKYHARTSDHYVWNVGIRFTSKGVTYKVLLPMAHDTLLKKDGTTSDRHIGLYCKGPVSAEDIVLATELFAHAFVSVYKHMYSNAIRDSKKRNGIVISE